MKKIFTLFSAALLAGLTFTSCLDGETSENTYTYQDCYTVTGSYATGYTLYSDNGNYATFDQSCFTGSEGFGTAERLYMTLQYTTAMVTADSKGLKNPNVAECYIMPTTNPMDLETATARNITQSDSCRAVNDLQVWAYRGYLTVQTYASYGSVRPTINLVYDTASIATDSITAQVCYNPHTSSTTSGGYFYTSIRLEPIAFDIPGSNDVVFTIKCNGISDKLLKVSRANFRKGNY